MTLILHSERKIMNMQQTIIRCHNLVLGHGKHQLSKPINLSLYQNQWLGVVGENGIGKSTFLKSILGIQPPISGQLTVFDKPVGICNDLISYIPQERELNLSQHISGKTLVKASFKSNKFGMPFFGQKFNKMLDQLFEIVGASSYANQAFETLSGGQKKRIYLIQALVNSPKLLLLDEPLADLDPQAKHDFIDALKKIHRSQNITLLIISHDMHEIAHELDNFIHFKNGHVHLCPQLPCLTEDKSVIL